MESFLTYTWPILLFMAWVTPNAIITVLFTDMVTFGNDENSWGMSFIDFLTKIENANYIAYALVGVAALWSSILYVLGWPTWTTRYPSNNINKTRVTSKQIISAVIPWGCLVVASVLTSFEFPLVVRVVTWIHCPVFVMLLKVWCTQQDIVKQDFDKTFGTCLDWLVLLTYVVLVFWAGHWFFINPWESFQSRVRNSTDTYSGIYEDVYIAVKTNITPEKCDKLLKGAFHLENEPEEFKKVEAACSRAETVFFALWATPWLYMVSLTLRVLFHIYKYCSMDENTKKAEECGLPCPIQIRKFLLSVLTVSIGAWVIVPATGAHANLVNGFAPAAFVCVVLVMLWALWNFSRIRRELKIWEEKDKDSLTPEEQNMIGVIDSWKQRFESIKGLTANEWVQAMMMGSSIVPGFYVLERLRRWWKVRQTSKDNEEENKGDNGENAVFDEVTDQFMIHLGAKHVEGNSGPQKWNICSILIKVCLLGELYFTLQVGGTKATYVFLSWVQDQLKAQSFEFVLALTFVVGFTMFMLPFVPGVPVYIFCGMVVTTAWTVRNGDAQSEFYTGCGIAVFLGLCLKLFACCGQYLIGRFLSRDIRVLKFVGADTQVTRAIAIAVGGEKTKWYGKVVVLVGGPDWPTSVMCGILKVNVPSMLCHTIPVLIIMTPCVMAGAYLASVTCDGQGSAATMASTFSLLAAVGQLGSMLLAMLFLQNIYTNPENGLDQEPKEGDPISPEDYNTVLKMREDEHDLVEAYDRVLMETPLVHGWRPKRGFVIALAAFLTFISNGLFTTDLAFENFSVSSRIQDNINACGLGGNALAIVKRIGWGALVAFALSVALHAEFVWAMSGKAKEEVSKNKKSHDGRSSKEAEAKNDQAPLLGDTT